MTTADYLTQLGKIVFGAEEIVPPDNPEFFRESIRLNTEAILYYRFADHLPEPYRERFRNRYRIQSAAALRARTALNELYRGLDAEGMRYAPMKGADLAFRIYPESALRYFNDFDILFHPDDCEKMLDLLPRLGWQMPCQTRRRRVEHHHYDQYVKGVFHLEPHYTFPCFGITPPDEIWREIRPAGDGSFRQILSPELNMLMLTRHAAESDYRLCSLPKLLLDAAHLMKAETVDWTKLRRMADRWNLPPPENLLGTWHEFFPPEILALWRPDRQAADAYRQLFLCQSNFINYSNAEWEMNTSQKFSARWLKIRMDALRPRNVRVKYRLPADAAGGPLLLAYGQEFSEKTIGFFRNLIRPNQRIRQWTKLIQVAERRHD